MKGSNCKRKTKSSCRAEPSPPPTQRIPRATAAAAAPVYAQLRGCIDLSVAAALIRRLDFYRQADFQAAILCDEKQLPTETLNAPVQTPCVVNSLWKGARLFVPAGGGVSISPDEALDEKNLLPDEKYAVQKLRSETAAKIPAAKWWWDESRDR